MCGDCNHLASASLTARGAWWLVVVVVVVVGKQGLGDDGVGVWGSQGSMHCVCGAVPATSAPAACFGVRLLLEDALLSLSSRCLCVCSAWLNQCKTLSCSAVNYVRLVSRRSSAVRQACFGVWLPQGVLL